MDIKSTFPGKQSIPITIQAIKGLQYYRTCWQKVVCGIDLFRDESHAMPAPGM